MALDEAMLEAADADGLRILRLYSWDPATLSFGRNEPATRRYDRSAVAARRIATVRRPTGGRAVWHDREVTYAVAAPATTFGTLALTYAEIHEMIAAALRSLGVDARLADRRAQAPVGAGACFASPAGGEVVSATGRKIVGSAQVRSGNAFLQHGSILLEAGQGVVASLTVGAADPPADVGLADLIGASATWTGTASAVAGCASSRWGAEPVAALPESVLERARELRPRFAADDWTWRR